MGSKKGNTWPKKYYSKGTHEETRKKKIPHKS